MGLHIGYKCKCQQNLAFPADYPGSGGIRPPIPRRPFRPGNHPVRCPGMPPANFLRGPALWLRRRLCSIAGSGSFCDLTCPRLCSGSESSTSVVRTALSPMAADNGRTVIVGGPECKRAIVGHGPAIASPWATIRDPRQIGRGRRCDS